ncbi:MAG TPA: aminoglycoside phosphotransferase family protein [Candidatus Microsaccharimonas sp.]|nr:aminoglycoside phosphotransferase family protein [Candidatus Microsaccharimonas sp.]
MVATIDSARTIAQTHFVEGDCTIASLGTGRINRTYLVQAADQKFVLQRMNSMFPTKIAQDFDVITKHLADCGWEAPTVVQTQAGRDFVEEANGTWWRAMSFIDSDDGVPGTLKLEQYEQVGSLLARLHDDLAKLDYIPVYTIPHFHDTPHYAQRLQSVQDKLTDEMLHQLAQNMQDALEALPELPGATTQLIHGDPQTVNMLFRGGAPFTLIDFDTIMLAPVWIDLGDMLRSLAEDALEQGEPFPLEAITAVAKGYYAQMAPAYSEADFLHAALVATQKLALELGMRFMTDIVEDNYFGFDTPKFSTRRESNIHRANVQWQIYTQCKETL